MNARNTQTIETEQAILSNDRTLNDFKNAGLLVSLAINLTIFTAWLVIELSDKYNAQIISYLQR